MSDINLKPCPFCGGKAQLYRNGKFSWVNCLECGVETPGDATSDTEAIASWNARAPSLPDGWALVPREPTEAMYENGWNAMFQGQWTGTEAALLGAGWDAMLAAAPKSPT